MTVDDIIQKYKNSLHFLYLRGDLIDVNAIGDTY